MADTVTLKNETKQAMTVNLDHEVYCRLRNVCGCSRGTVKTRERPKDGSPGGVQTHKKRHPAVITLMPGATSEPLHPAAIRLPQVKTGVERGTISVSRPAAEVPPNPPAAEAPPARSGRRTPPVVDPSP